MRKRSTEVGRLKSDSVHRDALKVALLCAAALVAGCCGTQAEATDESVEPVDVVEPEPAAAESTLAERAYSVLKERCWGCHGEPGKQAYGETVPVDWILDYDMLIETKTVMPGNAGKSRLIYITAVEGKMPRAFDDDGIPSVEDELTEEELDTLIEWVKADAPRWPDED